MNIKQKIWHLIRPIARPLGARLVMLLFFLLRIFPVQKNKIVASAYGGRRYDDNPRFIMEELHRLRPDADIVWVQDKHYPYDLPSWMRPVRWYSFRWLYEHATARVWLNNSTQPDYFVKRKSQLYVETWHGGLGIKRLFNDMVGDLGVDFAKTLFLKNASDMADVYISNSNHLSVIYRRAFRYHGPIWKCGYPKNDMLVQNRPEDGERARRELGIPAENKLLLYAPTFRSRFEKDRQIDMAVYDLDLLRLRRVLTERFGGEWIVSIRFHAQLRPFATDYQQAHPGILDVTDYQDMQRLLMATDVMVSDYSSCIFDAALRRIPCFAYANDFDQYKNEERGVYYDMEELPFPYARNNDEMERNVRAFDCEEFLRKWDAFAERMGLNETGHAARDIAEKINDYLDGRAVQWPNNEPKTIKQQ